MPFQCRATRRSRCNVSRTQHGFLVSVSMPCYPAKSLQQSVLGPTCGCDRFNAVLPGEVVATVGCFGPCLAMT